MTEERDTRLHREEFKLKGWWVALISSNIETEPYKAGRTRGQDRGTEGITSVDSKRRRIAGVRGIGTLNWSMPCRSG